MTTRASAPDRVPGAAANPAVWWHLDAHLEGFWPSRRIDAFDGLCPRP